MRRVRSRRLLAKPFHKPCLGIVCGFRRVLQLPVDQLIEDILELRASFNLQG